MSGAVDEGWGVGGRGGGVLGVGVADGDGDVDGGGIVVGMVLVGREGCWGEGVGEAAASGLGRRGMLVVVVVWVGVGRGWEVCSRTWETQAERWEGGSGHGRGETVGPGEQGFAWAP